MDNTRAKIKRGANTTPKQKQLLIEFIKNKPLLISGKQSNSFTAKDAQLLWQEVTEILNSVPGGANKDWKDWRKTWQDLRSRTKSKSSKNIVYISGTGGGPPATGSFSSVEEEVLQIIKEVSVKGHAVAESEASFDFCEVVPSTSEGTVADAEERPSNSEIIESEIIIDDDHDKCTLEVLPNVLNEKVTKGEKKKFPKKVEHLINSAVAATNFQDNLNKKLKIKEKYYERKLYFMEKKSEYQDRKIQVMLEKNVLQEKHVLALQQVAIEVKLLREILMKQT